MNKHPNTESFSSYLDGELSPREVGDLEAHLEACGSCHAIFQELAQVQRQARALPDQLPEKDLWPGIAEAIRFAGEGDPQIIALHPPSAAPPVPRNRTGFRLSYFQAAAAGLVLALFSGAMGAFLSRGPSIEPLAVVVDDPSPWVEVVSSVNPGLGEMAREVARLEALLVQHRDGLDPATTMVVQKNLAVIDRAIGESLSALESDPESPFLEAHLTRSVAAKADYLREAVSFVVPMG